MFVNCICVKSSTSCKNQFFCSNDEGKLQLFSFSAENAESNHVNLLSSVNNICITSLHYNSEKNFVMACRRCHVTIYHGDTLQTIAEYNFSPSFDTYNIIMIDSCHVLLGTKTLLDTLSLKELNFPFAHDFNASTLEAIKIALYDRGKSKLFGYENIVKRDAETQELKMCGFKERKCVFEIPVVKEWIEVKSTQFLAAPFISLQGKDEVHLVYDYATGKVLFQTSVDFTLKCCTVLLNCSVKKLLYEQMLHKFFVDFTIVLYT